ncbi:MAG: ABC transporter permease [Nitrospinota bacterium]|nr:ABC transporter permease [Nitrospinota bacterium]
MTGYIIRRLIQAVILVKCVLIFIFLLLHLTGDPVLVMAPEDADEEYIQRLRKAYGFDKPLLTQYGIFFRKVVKGDFGESFEHGEPALKIFFEHLPATLELALTAFFLSALIGIPLGIVSAVREKTITDRVCMIGAVLGQAIPNFWLGLMMILVFAVYWRMLPSFGREGIAHIVMPAFAASIYHTARLARLMRSEMLEVLRQDYIVTARSKGLIENVVLYRHALKNSSIPIVTQAGLDLGIMLGGTVIIETVFAWPGVGRLTIEAIHNRDFPIVQVSVFMLASMFVFINLAVDILYVYLDPRIEYQ